MDEKFQIHHFLKNHWIVFNDLECIVFWTVQISKNDLNTLHILFKIIPPFSGNPWFMSHFSGRSSGKSIILPCLVLLICRNAVSSVFWLLKLIENKINKKTMPERYSVSLQAWHHQLIIFLTLSRCSAPSMLSLKPTLKFYFAQSILPKTYHCKFTGTPNKEKVHWVCHSFPSSKIERWNLFFHTSILHIP